MNLENNIKQIIYAELSKLNRSDLFRAPLIAFSSAHDRRYRYLKTIIGKWHLTPRELHADANSVISYFVPFTKEVALDPRKTKVESALWGESYAVINDYFSHINEEICNHLVNTGHSAMTIAATHTYDPKDMRSMWSHRSAAVIAGIGSFGANRMVITEKGAAGRFCTVLTSAMLKVEKNTAKNPCLYIKDGSCILCFVVCPVDALKSDSLDKFACQAETKRAEKVFEEREGLHNADVCGKCISACPYTYIA